MTTKTIAGLGGEGTETKGPVWYVAINGVATRSRQAVTFGPTTASAQCTDLEAAQLPPALIHHHYPLRPNHRHHFRHRRRRAILSHYPICLHLSKSYFTETEEVEEEEKEEREENPRSRHLLLQRCVSFFCFAELER